MRRQYTVRFPILKRKLLVYLHLFIQKWVTETDTPDDIFSWNMTHRIVVVFKEWKDLEPFRF